MNKIWGQFWNRIIIIAWWEHNDLFIHIDQTEGVDKRCSAVLRGVSQEDRLIGRGVRNKEPDGDTRRRDSDLDRFEPSDRRNTLRPVSLLFCINEMISRAVLAALDSPGAGLQVG